MLAYAASRPVVVDRRPHPNAMLMIIGAHVAVIAAVMSARMDLPRRIFDPPPKLISIPLPKDPPPIHQTNQRIPTNSGITHPVRQVVTPTLGNPPTGTSETILDPGTLRGAGVVIIPKIPEPPTILPVNSGPQLLTPASELKPAYPPSKLLNEEEAVLRLKLTIDEHGRVVAVDPVGRADRAFLDAARRHLLAHWRYKPALDDGHAVASTAVITLHFELDG